MGNNVSDRANLIDLINEWHAECSETRLGDGGTPFQVIPGKRMLECLNILAKTLKENGFSFEEMKANSTTIIIVNKCWREDKIVKMSKSKVHEAKESLSLDWKGVLGKFSKIGISKLDDNEKITPIPKEIKPPKEEFELKLDPTKRYSGINATGFAEPVYDLEFLAELGVKPPKDENE